jgi:hypothetical protein
MRIAMTTNDQYQNRHCRVAARHTATNTGAANGASPVAR